MWAICSIYRLKCPSRSHANYLEYNEKSYPPKFVVSLANKFANDRELDPDELRLKHVISFLEV
jgi:hypothetical protein